VDTTKINDLATQEKLGGIYMPFFGPGFGFGRRGFGPGFGFGRRGFGRGFDRRGFGRGFGRRFW
jgi:hypothetical protein